MCVSMYACMYVCKCVCVCLCVCACVCVSVQKIRGYTRLSQSCDKVVYNEQGGDKVVNADDNLVKG